MKTMETGFEHNINSTFITKNKKEKLYKKLYKQRYLFMMVMPAVILMFIFHYLPLSGWVIAFKNYSLGKGLWNSDWSGLKHFKTFFMQTSE